VTGTAKSYVLYGLAAILLAEGVVDRELVSCPSKTIGRQANGDNAQPRD
jgi:type III restriction enzyme